MEHMTIYYITSLFNKSGVLLPGKYSKSYLCNNYNYFALRKFFTLEISLLLQNILN